MKHSKGFTLVELSIVLVIIGLLIGGILTAQSMISTAKVNSFISQIGQFDSGVANFKTRYNALPGDSKHFGGDQNGLIDMGAANGWGIYVNSYAGEIPNFWGNMMPEQYKTAPSNASPGIIPTPTGANKNVPLSTLGKDGSFVFASALATVYAYAAGDVTNPQNYYAIISSATIPTAVSNCCYQLAPTTTTNSAVKPVDALALDTKMDNGKADSGVVLSGRRYPSAGDNGGIINLPLPECNDTASTYNVGNSGFVCTPLIRIGGKTGDPS